MAIMKYMFLQDGRSNVDGLADWFILLLQELRSSASIRENLLYLEMISVV